AEPPGLGPGHDPGRDLTGSGAWVARVELRVDEAVERHRESASSHHGERQPDERTRTGIPVDGEERADVREREREDRVLQLDERREAARQRKRGGAHVCLCVEPWSPAASSSPWTSAGWSTANPSRQPPGDPGMLTINVAPRRPASPRESIACGVRASAPAR